MSIQHFHITKGHYYALFASFLKNPIRIPHKWEAWFYYIWISGLHFHFILIFDGVVISSKIRDDSTFWLHVIPSFFFYRVYLLEEIIWNRLFFFSVLCGKVEKITKYCFWLQKVLKIQNQYHFWTLWTLIKIYIWIPPSFFASTLFE